MSVHLAISKQVENHINGQREFKRLDAMREATIEKVVADAKNGKDFSVTEINQITNEMNGIAMKFGFPTRKTVTKEMVSEYANRSNTTG
ncbi:MAG: YpbS family protein [Bacillaceae bacterium]|nr:YpbS family protein [Bacillaceae bacterium]